MNNMKEIKEWVKVQHEAVNQKRTDGSPYYHHPHRVGDMVSGYYIGESYHDDVAMAGYCHDILEDTGNVYAGLCPVIGYRSADIVREVTNRYTKVAYPEWDRAERKLAEARKLGLVSFEAKIVKLCDMIDNLSDIDAAKPKMAKMYKLEKLDVLHYMAKDSPHILNNPLFKKVKELCG